MDGVVPYRLEMQAKLSVDGSRDLYGYWGDAIYRRLTDGEDHPLIVNLASKEYSRAVEPWLRPGDRFVTCVFGEEGTDRNGRPKVKVKATQGEDGQGQYGPLSGGDPRETEEDLKGFQEEGFRFRGGSVRGWGAGVYPEAGRQDLGFPFGSGILKKGADEPADAGNVV